MTDMPTYSYVMVVRPKLTEHEGFDPEKLRQRIARVMAATIDEEVIIVGVARP